MVILSANNYWDTKLVCIWSLLKHHGIDTIIFPILQMRKLELREVIEFA